jgi:CPA1 family monovalent cation:H+ antiporter
VRQCGVRWFAGLRTVRQADWSAGAVVNQVVEIESLVLEILLVVVLVALVTRRFRVPYTVALVLAGLALSLVSRLEVGYTPQLILSLLLPPLVFEAAFHLSPREIRRDWATVLLLAVPGVVLSMLVVGSLVAWSGAVALPAALVFGALIAATDPVSVVAIFRRLGVPKRLEVMLEAESLFNDGTAIVLFNLALAGALSGVLQPAQGVFDFARIAGGGLFIGLALGWLADQLLSRVDDHLVETTLTVVIAFGSYLVAEQLHVSGVLAVLTAGLVTGSLSPRSMSPTTRIVVFNFWEFAAFLASSAVFLLIGARIDLTLLLQSWAPILWAIGGVLATRAVATYLTSRYVARVPIAWSHVLFWGGPRGAIALALALSLPASMGTARETVLAMTYGVVLFTILVQSLSMDALLRRLGLAQRSGDRLEYERRHARALAARAGYEHLQRMHHDGVISSHTWDLLRPTARLHLEALTDAVQESLRNAPEMEREELVIARRESLRAQRAMLARLRREGILSDEPYGELVAEVDLSLDLAAEGQHIRNAGDQPAAAIRQLLFIVVQDRDADRASNALAACGASCTRLKSQGGFLGRESQLLLVGIPEGRLLIVERALGQACRTRVEHVAMPFEGIPGSAAEPIEVQVHGATMLVFEVERYEEI